MPYLFFIRHGKVNKKYGEVFYGQMDVELSEEGFEASEKVATFLSGFNIEVVYSSPLIRARYPAELLSVKRGVPLILSDELKEADYGLWTGKKRKEVYKDPLFYKRLNDDSIPAPFGESIRELRSRSKRFFESLRKSIKGELIPIFTHGGFIKALVCELLDIPSKNFYAIEVFHLRGVLVYVDVEKFVIRGINISPYEISSIINSSYW